MYTNIRKFISVIFYQIYTVEFYAEMGIWLVGYGDDRIFYNFNYEHDGTKQHGSTAESNKGKENGH